MKINLIGGSSATTIGEIFETRGLNQLEISKLNESSLHDPFLLKNMKEAVDVVHQAITNSDGLILIQQDPDADGYSSTMAIEHYLATAHPEIESRIHILIQEDKSHDISLSEIDRVLAENPGKNISLVLAPDCSSNEPKKHKTIVEKYSSPVVVLDHHEAKEYSPYATMVNCQLDDYPNKLLSGVGIVQKFMSAYDKTYGFSHSDKYYDLVAIGIVGDMIELTSYETIYMVQRGMKEINHPFLKALYKKQDYSLKGEITPTGISFYIAPLINATTRTASLEEKRMITKAMSARSPIEVQSTKRGESGNPAKTEIIQEQAVRVMTNIKSRQGRDVDKVVSLLERQIEEKSLEDNQIIILETAGDILTSYNGLLANKFLQRYKKPIVVGREYDGVFRGSARGDDKSELANLMSFFNSSGLVNYAQGHEAAHGVEFSLEKKEDLVQHFNATFSGTVFEPIHQVDFVSELKGNTAHLIPLLEDITMFGNYWGRGVEEPQFLLQNVRIKKSDLSVTGSFNSHTIKFKSEGLEFIAFRQSTKIAKMLSDNELTTVDLVGVSSINSFNGESTLQVKVKEIEVKKAQAFYF